MPSVPHRPDDPPTPLPNDDPRAPIPLGDLVRLALPTKEQRALADRSGLPMPALPTVDAVEAAFYTVSAIDKWGRLSDRSALLKLGWLPGTAIDITRLNKIIVVAVNDGGPYRVTRQTHLRLPAGLRHSAHIEAGDRFLVAACCERKVLVAYPMPVLDAMVLAFHQRKLDGEVR